MSGDRLSAVLRATVALVRSTYPGGLATGYFGRAGMGL